MCDSEKIEFEVSNLYLAALRRAIIAARRFVLKSFITQRGYYVLRGFGGCSPRLVLPNHKQAKKTFFRPFGT